MGLGARHVVPIRIVEGNVSAPPRYKDVVFGDKGSEEMSFEPGRGLDRRICRYGKTRGDGRHAQA